MIVPVVTTPGVGDDEAIGAVVAAAVVGDVGGGGDARVAGEPHAATSAMSISSRTDVVIHIMLWGAAAEGMTIPSSILLRLGPTGVPAVTWDTHRIGD